MIDCNQNRPRELHTDNFRSRLREEMLDRRLQAEELMLIRKCPLKEKVNVVHCHSTAAITG